MGEVITFPVMSKDESAQGVLATWFVRTGEQVRAGQVIAEVMVDQNETEAAETTASTASQTASPRRTGSWARPR